MNKARRKRIDTVMQKLSELMAEVDDLRDQEELAYEALPESLRQSDRGFAMQESIEALQEAMDLLEQADSAMDNARGDA